jgi:hypothetical protein
MRVWGCNPHCVDYSIEAEYAVAGLLSGEARRCGGVGGDGRGGGAARRERQLHPIGCDALG